MILDLTPEVEARISEAAEQHGLTVAELLAEAAQNVVEVERREESILSERLEDADRGDFLTKEEMDLRFQRMLRH